MITSVIVSTKISEKQVYPCVKECEGIVVSFTEKNVGIILSGTDPANNYGVGELYSEWNESEFKPFKGKILIEVS